MAGELEIQTTLSRDIIPVMNVAQLVYCLIELRPAEGSVAASQTLPLNLCLVLDHSGSMSGTKLDNLRDATNMVLDLLQPRDYLSVIFFSSRNQVAFPSQPVGDQTRRSELRARVAALKAGGGTNMAPAMEAGLVELRKQMQSRHTGGQVNRLVLLTDGMTEKEKRCLEQAEQAARINVPITALGIGKDWNDKLMQQIASRSSGGEAGYIATPEEIRSHFARTVQQMQAVALQHATLNVQPALSIETRSIFKVHPLISRLQPEPRPDRVAGLLVGEIERGHGQTLLVEFVVPSRPAGSYRIAQVEATYDVAQAGITGQRATADVLLQYAHDPAATSPPNPRVMNIVEKVSAFKLQTRALDDLEAGNIPAATQKLKGALTHLLNQGDTTLAATVQEEITNLEKGRAMTSEGRKTIRFESGKTVRLNKST